MLSPTIASLVAIVGDLARVHPSEVPGARALEEAAALLVQVDRLRAVALARVADVDRRQLHDLDGCPSTGAWVAQQHTSMSREEIGLARRLDRVPQIADRVLAGGLSLEGGVLLARAVDLSRRFLDRPDGLIDGQPGEPALTAVIVDGITLLVGEARGGVADDDPALVRLRKELVDIAQSPAAQLVRWEAGLLVLARHLEPGQVRPAVGMLVDALLPNQLAERAENGHRERRLELHRDEVGWTVRGRLDLECGELFFTALSASMATDADNPTDTAAAAAARIEGLDPYEDSCRVVRSIVQLRHDALRLLLRRLLDSGALGSRAKVAPQLAVTVTLEALHDQPGALPATAASGSRLPAALVRRLACDSALTRFVFGLGHRVIETSHTGRTLSAAERRIKQLETGGSCQAAGCWRGLASGHLLVPHHPQLYAHTKTSSLADTVLLCPSSHHDVHEGRKTLRLKDGRLLGPDGWVDASAA